MTRRLMVILTAGLLLTTAARAQQSNNHILHAVPTPHSTGSGQAGEVTIDGRLDDWDLSGQIEVFAHFRLRNSYSARVAAMYDADYFYLSVQWRDPTPMFNMIDPRFDAGSGWRSDCLQLRVMTDVVMHIDSWYATAHEEPVVRIAYGSYRHDARDSHASNLEDIDNAIGVGARQAFRKGEDGRGYTQEIAIPWALLTGASAIVRETGEPFTEGRGFATGDSFAMGMEFLWGGPDGQAWPIHRYADLLAEGTTSREFFWTAERSWGTVKLMPEGNLDLPTVEIAGVEAYLQTTEGPIEINYEMPFDGFATIVVEDEDGVRVRNLVGMAPREAGEQVDYWDGADDDGRLLPAGRYRWRGLVHAGINPVYEMTYGTPGNPPWDNADNTGAWMSDHNAPLSVAAGDSVMVLAARNAEAGWALIGTDLDGRRLWGQRRSDISHDIEAVAADATYAYSGLGGRRRGSRPGIGRLDLKTGAYAPFTTAQGSKLIIEVLAEGEVGYLTGLTALDDRLAATLAGPDVVRFFDKTDGSMLGEVAREAPRGLTVGPNGELYLISGATIVRIENGVVTEVVGEGLDRPHEVTVDADGRIYVSDRGLHQVLVFNPDGTAAGTIGIEGGRPKPGRWEPGGMRHPAGIAVDPRNRLWVMEWDIAPKRISVWSLDGEFLKDFIGPTTYGGAGAFADSRDKTRVFGSGCEWRLDYDNQTAEIRYNCLERSDRGELLLYEGREYFMTLGRPPIMLYIRDGDSFRLIGMFGRSQERTIESVREDHNRRAGRDWHHFLWMDLNSDGQIQADEVQFSNGDIAWNTGYWGGHWLDDDFNIYISPGGYGREQALSIPRVGWTAEGVPVYDTGNKHVYLDQEEPPERSGGPGKLFLADGETIIFGSNPVTAVRPDGSIVWTYPDRYPDVHGSHRAPMPPDDATLIGMMRCIGVADSHVGRVWAANSNMGRLYLMTTDGLMVASVFQDNRMAPEPWPEDPVPGIPLGGVTMGAEWFGGYFFRSDPTDEYYVIAGTTAYNMIRLDGFDTLQRLDGEAFAFDTEHLSAAEDLQRRRAAEAAADKELAIARVDTAPEIDGDIGDFPEEAFVEWSAGPYRARGAVATDGADLLLAYEVFNAELVNAGEDYTQLFVTGDSVDLQLGTDPAANPDRGDPVVGDLRLLISVMNGEPVAVLYRWKVADGQAKSTQTFRSPWRDITLDAVVRLDDARIAVQHHGRRYTVEAAIPLETLSFQPRTGETYRLDLGVIYADATGANRAARVYWANQATGLTADIPGEIMAHPNLWGTARLGE